MLFLIPGTSETLRVNGHAELDATPDVLEQLAARGKPATIALRVTVDECFFHCGKAFIRSGLWKPESWPEDPHKVSFGKMYAARANASNELAEVIDQSIRDDYENNL